MSAAAASTSIDVSLPTSARVLTWRRLRRDRLALIGGIVIVVVVLGCFPGLTLAEHLLGHNSDMIFPSVVNVESKPVPPWTRVSTRYSGSGGRHGTTLLILGADSALRRDEFLRVLAGGRASLEVALGATLLALVIGTILGSIAGFY